jgi:hypothetical protein
MKDKRLRLSISLSPQETGWLITFPAPGAHEQRHPTPFWFLKNGNPWRDAGCGIVQCTGFPSVLIVTIAIMRTPL